MSRARPARVGGGRSSPRSSWRCWCSGRWGPWPALWRFTQGLGAATAMNDGYPWGIWIAFDVVTGTGLACGGYAVALLVYILNQGQYHPLVRPPC